MKTLVRTGYELEIAESRSSDPQIFTTMTGGEATPGTVRYEYQNGEGSLCVFTGYSWAKIQDINYNINLSHETRKIIDWARSKMVQEEKIKKLCQTNQAVANAYSRFREAEEQLEIMTILSEK